MTEILQNLPDFFNYAWNLFLKPIPGTAIPIAAIYIAIFVVVISFDILGGLFGVSTDDSGDSGGNNKKIKINKNRKDDEK